MCPSPQLPINEVGVKFNHIACAFMLAIIAACSPSSVLKPEDTTTSEPAPTRETTEPLNQNAPFSSAPFSAGKWIDEDGTLWRAKVDGKSVQATAICGYSAGLVLEGAIRKDFLHFDIKTSDANTIGSGRAMIVDEHHAYYVVSGKMQTHGLYHFDHEKDGGECGLKSADAQPLDLRPSPQKSRREYDHASQ